MASLNPIPRFIDECFNYVSDRYGGEVVLKQKRAVLVFESTANGYHHFRIRPLIGIDMPMHLEEEPDNMYDENAILIRIPSESFFSELDKKRKTKEGQCVGEVLNKVVGRLPKNVAAVVKAGVESEDITHSFAFYTGDLIHGGQREGGGVKLRCIFILLVRHVSVQNLKRRLENIGLDVASIYATQ